MAQEQSLPSMDLAGGNRNQVLSGHCPDSLCRTKLFFPAYDSSVECTGCGQRHQRSALRNVEVVKNPEVALHNILKNLLVGNFKPKKGADSVKVLGISNYQCKLLSPLLTKYGMDKKTGEAKLLVEMGQGEMFDCGILGSRAFMIEPEHIEVTGYGRDGTGSMKYLRQTLDAISKSNDNEERLLPIHADGDGHCLVHAVSRALIGRELFWHALRENLKMHFSERLETYQELFMDFIDKAEWDDIIAECDPAYMPSGGEPLGLRNIHIFGLANVLRRPIVLLDSLIGIQSSGDYTGVFLPNLVPPENCKDKDGTLNKPLCIAWSSSGRNHYIALVGVKGRPVPKLPNWMFPKAWGVPQELIPSYIDMDDQGRVEIGGDKCLQDKYILKLVSAMEKVFESKNQVRTSLVADYHQYVFKNTGMVGVDPALLVQQTCQAVAQERLYRCLVCEAVIEWTFDLSSLSPGGALYELAVKIHGPLNPHKKYSFPTHDMVCTYDAQRNTLEPDKESCRLKKCQWCQGSQVRLLNGDGSIRYENGDRTCTPSTASKCRCGFKHYWDGKEYDNLPEILPVTLEWSGKVVGEKVYWFQNESDPSLNSNVFEVAQKIVQKHFPGEFGSERLVQKVVDSILIQTKKTAPLEERPVEGASGETHMETDASWRADSSSKIILTGFKSKTMHKEELTQSKAEGDVKRRIEQKAAVNQKRRTDELEKAKTTAGSAQSSPSSIVSMDPDSSPGSPAKPSSASGSRDKRIRVSTSDGRQLTISLKEGLTFTALLKQLEESLEVDQDLMKIRSGFPPKELKPSVGEDGQEVVLALQHGDRVTVEITEVKSTEDSPSPSSAQIPWPAKSPSRKSWSGFDADARNHSAHELLNQLTQSEASDSLDTSIASLALMANLMGKDLWTYVQAMPHLFSVGGLFYQQVARDLGLTDGKHCTLPSLPNKVFRYSAKEDRLELCLEPHGHFSIEPNIEAKVLAASADSTGATSSSGSSGILVNRSSCSSQMAFTGQGHTLGGSPSAGTDDKMPQDLDLQPSSHHHPKLKAMKFKNFSNSGSRPSSIDEEDEESSQAAGDSPAVTPLPATKEGVYKRVGPGYSVVDPAVHDNSQTFKALASQIDSLVQDMDVDAEDVFPKESTSSMERTTQGMASPEASHGSATSKAPVTESRSPETLRPSEDVSSLGDPVNSDESKSLDSSSKMDEST